MSHVTAVNGQDAQLVIYSCWLVVLILSAVMCVIADAFVKEQSSGQPTQPTADLSI